MRASLRGKQGKRVVTFGELVLRLDTRNYERFVQAKEFEVRYGASEANVAVSLTNLGIQGVFVSVVPDHDIGQAGINLLRGYGVDTSHIIRAGDRLGLLYVERGASQRPTRVIYDRAHSSIAEMKSGMIDWGKVFEGADWFHFSGITPALSDTTAIGCRDACLAAKKAGIKISCDYNYRSKLWPLGKARSVMGKLAEYVDVSIGNKEDAEKILGITAGKNSASSSEPTFECYRKVARKLASTFGFEKVAMTLRESPTSSDNDWSAFLYDGKDFLQSRNYNIHIVDRLGGGDAFAAGLIYGILTGMSSEDTVNFAVAASCLKHSIQGDFNLVSKAEVEALLKGDGTARVER
jgi:2-dehydro-3-deoxygluconokinase